MIVRPRARRSKDERESRRKGQRTPRARAREADRRNTHSVKPARVPRVGDLHVVVLEGAQVGDGISVARAGSARLDSAGGKDGGDSLLEVHVAGKMKRTTGKARQ